jgi:DNA-binding transcriptional LysR family regulator
VVDIKRIRHFVALAETLNFRRASERLHIAQPALSVSIQKLEAELGTKLFVRTPVGVTLTASGEASLAAARKALFHACQFEVAARGPANGTGGILRVSFVGSATHGMLQKLVALFRAEAPGVELVLSDATSIGILQGIEDDSYDVGIVRTPLLRTTSARLVSLERDELVAALPRNNTLSGKQILELSDLAHEQFIMYNRAEAAALRAAAMLACEHSGFVPQIAQEAGQIQTLLALVDSGLGVALVPSVMRERFANERIVYRTLANCPSAAQVGIGLLYPPDRETAAGRRFRTLAANAFPSAHA